ncbi:MAG: TonB-dependent receptor [Planctomycetes bacterium]|nr:TonB-dependent receptor [Planctomycetota bacterium]
MSTQVLPRRPRPVARSFRFARAAIACAACGAWAFAQDQEPTQATDLAELSLEDLLGIEVETVHGASRRSQSSLEAPSSVALVERSDLDLFDRRTLAEVLRSIGGLDVTNDRNYEHLGVRGFNPLGDYNSRVLLSLEGHRLNNAIYDTAPIGRDLPIDIGLLERVEFARGPGSSLYGSNAFFGVLELRPRTGGDIDGWELEAGAASFGGLESRATFGRELADGTEWLVSASAFSTDGPTLTYDEFASTPTGGTTRGTDYEESYSFYSSWIRGDWTVLGGYGSREKGIPTGSFDTVFDADNRTTDAQGFLDVAWRPELSADTELEARVAYDQYEYDGFYLYDTTGSGGLAEEPYLDDAHATGLSTSLLLTTTTWADHTVSLGAEARRSFALDQHAYDVFGDYVDEERQRTDWGVFADDEWSFADRWRLRSGLRLDDATDIEPELSPRLGLIWLADECSAVKLLYGRAFRAPNAYESFYGDSVSLKPNPALQPEEIETYELVWERVVAGRWRASASIYHYEIGDMIVEGVDPSDGVPIFQNQERVTANGLELEGERSFDGGSRVRASWSLQKAINDTLDEELANSPRQLGKLGFDTPLGYDDVRFALEAQATSSRLTHDRDRTEPFVVVNATFVTQRLGEGVELALGVHNLFDSDYYDPVGSEFQQDSLLQDGRSFRLRLSISR